MNLIQLLNKIPSANIKTSIVVLGVILGASFLVYTIIFAIHSYLFKNECTLKVKFNQLNQYNVANQTNYLTKLSTNNQVIKAIVGHIKNFNVLVKTRTDNIKECLEKLTLLNKNYSIVKSIKLSKKISAQIIALETSIATVQNIVSVACSYTKNSEKILSVYRDLTQTLFSFYCDKIPESFKNEQIKNIFINIRDTLTDANYALAQFDNKTLIARMSSLEENITSVHTVLFNLFSVIKALEYIAQLEQKATSMIKKVKVLNQSEKHEFETRLVEGRVQIKQITDCTHRLTLDRAKICIYLSIAAFNKALNVIDLNERTVVLFEQNYQVLKAQVSILQKEYENTVKVINDLKECFQTSIDELNEINVFKGKLNTIFDVFYKLDKKIQNKTSPTGDVVTIIEALITKIIEWKANELKFCEMIKQKYTQKMSLIDRLYDTEFQLTQLYALHSKQEKSVDLLKQITELIKQTQDLKQNSLDNFFVSYTEVEQQLYVIQQRIREVVMNVTYNDTIKAYNQKLIQYANKFYHEAPSNKQVIEYATNLYNENKYSESLECLINFLTQIKKISKENNIKLFE